MTERVPEPVPIIGPPQELDLPISEPGFPQIFEGEDDTPTVRHKSSEPEVPCTGYELTLSDSQSPFASYPFLLHATKDMPWKVILSTEKLVLRSNLCTGYGRSSKKGKEVKPLACTFCSSLDNDTTVMGIRHRSLDGAHENTPWSYLTPAETYASLLKKNGQINHLRLRSLNNAATIGVRNRHLDAWKRVAAALGREDIPRIRSLMAAQTRAGASVFSIIEKIDDAAKRKYRPRGYDQQDFERAFLRLLGRLYSSLLNAYLDTSLSLHQQLVHLSYAAHLVLALYNRDKGDFIPVQSYFDLMSMIKNAYFCLAKAQVDNPNGKFFLILLGTDGLEKIFGKV